MRYLLIATIVLGLCGCGSMKPRPCLEWGKEDVSSVTTAAPVVDLHQGVGPGGMTPKYQRVKMRVCKRWGDA